MWKIQIFLVCSVIHTIHSLFSLDLTKGKFMARKYFFHSLIVMCNINSKKYMWKTSLILLYAYPSKAQTLFIQFKQGENFCVKWERKIIPKPPSCWTSCSSLVQSLCAKYEIVCKICLSLFFINKQHASMLSDFLFPFFWIPTS